MKKFAMAVLSATVLTMMQAGRQIARSQPVQQQAEYWVYVGTASYTGGPSKKLYMCRFDARSGELKLLGVAATTLNPGFVAVHQPYLYIVNEIGDFRGKKNGAVSAFRINRDTGKLIFLNQVPSLGANPSYVTVSANGRFVLVASYYGGVMTLPIRVDGSLGEPVALVRQSGTGVKAARPEGSHPHSVVLSPDNHFAVIVDLGLDKLFIYRFNQATGSLTASNPPFVRAADGSGPRHLAFVPDGRFAYVVSEIQSTVSTYAYQPQSGAFHLLQTLSTLPSGVKGPNTGAEVQVAPSGRFVYTSNRGHDSIAVFAIDSRKGTLTAIQDIPTGGKTPRNFVLDPSGNFLLVGNQDSDKVVVFRVDQRTGRLAPSGKSVDLPSPACIAFARIP